MERRARTSAAAAVRFLALLVGAAFVPSMLTVPARAWVPDAPPAKAERKPLKGLQLQPLDEPLQPLNPAKPRTEQEQKRLEATAWFMTGKLKETRGDAKGALEAYRKAVELDPTSISVYHSLVPLEFTEGNQDAAVQYALKAVELDPDDFRLLHWLGRHMALKGKTDEAIDLLEKAAHSSDLKKESGIYVVLASHLAILYTAKGDKEKAADSYNTIFEALNSPSKFGLDGQTRAALLNDDSTSFERIGQAFLDAGRTELAIKAFERAAENRRGQPGNLSYNLTRVYLQTKQLDKALEELQKYFDAQLQSKGRDAYKLLAEILAAMEKSDELLPRLEELAKKDAHNSTLQCFLAEQYLERERLDEAEALFKKVVEESDAEGYVGLVAVYHKQKRPKELLESLVKALQGGKQLERLETEVDAVAKDEELLNGLIEAGRELAAGDNPTLDVAGSLILAKLAAGGEKSDAAVEFYRFALKQAKDQRAFVIYNELGEHLIAADRFDEAAKVYEEAANDPLMRPARWTFLLRLSHAQEYAGRTDEAVASVAEAKKLRPNEAILAYQEAWIYYHAKKWDEAIPLFEQVISSFPEEKKIVRDSQLSLSNIHVQRGDMAKGEAVLEKILEAEPDDPSINNDLGYLYADQGKNLEKAESMIRKAIAAEPENPAYLDSMGWVLVKLGKHQEALPHLEKAVTLPGGADPTILEHLGDCYDALGNAGKATETWQQALDGAIKEAIKQQRPDQEGVDRLKGKLGKAKTAAKDEGP